MSDVKLAVLGNPIHHSLSPQIHQHFAAQCELAIHYEAIEVPVDDFSNTVRLLQAQDYAGVNVTVPFKTQAFEMANSRDEYAAMAAAANTLSFHADQRIHAANTDGRGLVSDLQNNLAVDLHLKSVLILGAGGAVQGILKPLLDAGVTSITICNRTYSKAQTLARHFAQHGEVFAIQQALMPYTPSFDLIINGTSASLTNEALDLPTNLLKNGSVCYDLMYSNTDTPFVAWAKSNGVKHAHDGLGMLIEQAAFAFEIWLTQKPDTLKTKAHIVKNIF